MLINCCCQEVKDVVAVKRQLSFEKDAKGNFAGNYIVIALILQNFDRFIKKRINIFFLRS